MNQPDPRLLLNCPTCGKPLQYVATQREADKTYLYVCVNDGYFVLGGARFATVGTTSGSAGIRKASA
jgi:uncharacterized protein YciI